MPQSDDQPASSPVTAEQWREVFDRLPQCVGIYSSVRDDRGRIIDFRVDYVNEAACRSNRLTRDEQIGRRLNDLLPGHRESGLFASYCKVVDTGEPFDRGRFDYRDLYGESIESRCFEIHAEKHGDGFIATWHEVAAVPAATGIDLSEKDLLPLTEAERARRADEQRFRLVVENSRDGIHQFDLRTGRYVFMSPAEERLTGFSLDELIGMTAEAAAERLHPDDRERVARYLDAVVRGEEPAEAVEYRWRVKSGEYRWFSDSRKLVRDAAGNPASLIGISRDITARRQAQDALARQRTMLQRVIDTIPVMLVIWDADLRRFSLNRYAEEVLGWTTSDANEGDFMACVYPDPTYRADVEAFMRTLDPGWRIFEATAKDGSVVRSEWTNIQLIDETMIGIGLDVRERERAARALRESDQRLHAAQEAGGVGTFEWDIRTNTIVWSTELEALYGLEPHSFAGTYEAWAQHVHPDDLEQAEADVKRGLATGEFDSEWRARLSDDEVRWLDARGWVEHDVDGQPVRMIGVNVDITERKRHEERTQTMLAELNHRVKNTLAVIQSIAKQTMRRSSDLATFREGFEQRLTSIANAHSLLTKAEWEGASLDEIIASEIEARIVRPDQCTVSGPRVLLRPKAALSMHMVIHELTTNACKYGALKSEQGRLEIEWTLKDVSGRTLDLVWREHCPHAVGEPSEEGYGSRLIGRLIEYEFDGEVHREFRSDGLRCRLHVPLAGGSASSPAPPMRPPARSVPEGCVLIVEDTHAQAMELCDELKERGIAVLGPIGTLARAMEVTARQRPVAAVLDVDLDGEKVYPLARRLREQGVPFMFVTGYHAPDLPEDLRDQIVLNKPVRAGAVEAFLRQHC